MYLDRFAEAFAAAGLGSVVFDNRNFGASDGEPRQEIDPWRQVRDYRDAITYAEAVEETDADRIGIWDRVTADMFLSSSTNRPAGEVRRRAGDPGQRARYRPAVDPGGLP